MLFKLYEGEGSWFLEFDLTLHRFTEFLPSFSEIDEFNCDFLVCTYFNLVLPSFYFLKLMSSTGPFQCSSDEPSETQVFSALPSILGASF